MTKILVVEDNEMNMKLFCDILSYNGYEVESASDGIEAYEKIKNTVFDLVILDMLLPKMDGISLIKKLKDDNITCPKIIVVSACAMDSDKQKALDLGIKNYITKPIDINNFIKTVNENLN